MRRKANLRVNESRVDKWLRTTLQSSLRRLWLRSELAHEAMRLDRVDLKVNKGSKINSLIAGAMLKIADLESVTKKTRYLYDCACCNQYFIAKQIEIDHIDGISSLFYLSDLPLYVETLFCPIDRLQRLCITCHRTKTSGLTSTD